MVEVLALPSVIVRVCRKLKPWYGPPSSPWHAERAVGSASALAAAAGVVPMALLKERVDISLTADTFWVHHDAQVGPGAGALGVARTADGPLPTALPLPSNQPSTMRPQDPADPSDMVYLTLSRWGPLN
jgi:hypothetical protein